jgi:hypothetical protein
MSRRVRCGTCWTAYDRSTFQGFTQERGSFDCYACGTELECWDTNLVPTYSIPVSAPAMGSEKPASAGQAWPD